MGSGDSTQGSSHRAPSGTGCDKHPGGPSPQEATVREAPRLGQRVHMQTRFAHRGKRTPSPFPLCVSRGGTSQWARLMPTHKPAEPAATPAAAAGPRDPRAKQPGGQTGQDQDSESLLQAPEDAVYRRCPINANKTEPKAHPQAPKGEGGKQGPMQRGGGGVKPRRVDHGVPAPPTGRLAPMISRTNSLNPQIGTQRQDACWASAP